MADEMTVGELINLGCEALRPCSDTPRLDAEILLGLALGKERSALIRDRHDEVTRRCEEDFLFMIERRKKHEPVHYITGCREFWSLPFKVNHGVFIPRPETELVVETALAILRGSLFREDGAPMRIADLGTGCGNIAVALAREVDNCEVFAVDISHKALEYARVNIEDNGVAGRVKLFRGDVFQPFSAMGLKVDMVVSNPPYISSFEMDALLPEVRDYEPRKAIYGGGDGLFYLRRIIDLAPRYLNPRGAVVLEIGMAQGKGVLKLMEKRGAYRDCKITKDYAGLDRVALAYAGASELKEGSQGSSAKESTRIKGGPWTASR